MFVLVINTKQKPLKWYTSHWVYSQYYAIHWTDTFLLCVLRICLWFPSRLIFGRRFDTVCYLVRNTCCCCIKYKRWLACIVSGTMVHRSIAMRYDRLIYWYKNYCLLNRWLDTITESIFISDKNFNEKEVSSERKVILDYYFNQF